MGLDAEGNAQPLPPPSRRGPNTTTVNHKLQDPPRALHGWKLHTTMFGLSLALLLSALETTIVATTLTTIGTHFDDYSKVGWVVTAYLVTYSGCILTYSKFTDVFGQKNVLLFSLAWFGIFSGLCAATPSMSLTHLIVFRALQGIGGSGVFSVVFVTIVDICPARLLGPYSAVASSTFAIANILGPIVGGVISDTADWKWIFLLNVPGSAIAGAILFKCFPGGDDRKLGKAAFAKIDVMGSILSIGSAVMLLYGLQTGGKEFPWNDARIIGTLVAGVVAVFLFFIYEWGLHRKQGPLTEPLLPIRLLKNSRICCLLISMMTGLVFSKTTRFGWQILALGGSLVLLGTGLLIELPFSQDVLPRSCGYQVILGMGLGSAVPAIMILTRIEVEDRDNAVVMGAVNTVRTMGGCIALSACSAILNNEMPKRVGELPVDTVASLLGSPTAVLPLLDDETGLMVRHSYHDLYRLQWIAVASLAAAELLFAFPPLFASVGKRPEVSTSHNLQQDEADHSASKVASKTIGQ
ncbi:MFS multidrug transporter [Colletotrichum plurivorum]|uniref:MFS multidrug transporter n=1 Tax=Colletotrichum plurivorum TaxID=2175906 RepID=A0A8H6JGN0_9PEZI|nr:MFS multidrug transporter [Colletotrichum plurivorum]